MSVGAIGVIACGRLDDDKIELSSIPAARLIASCAIVFSVDIESVIEFGTKCGLLFVLLFAATLGPLSICRDLGDVRPGETRLLITELVGDVVCVTELLIIDVDVVDKLLFVMEVKIA